MIKRFVVVASLCALVAMSVGANCSISLKLPTQVESGQAYELLINPAGGTYTYFITEFFTADAVSRTQSGVELFGPTEPGKVHLNHGYAHRTTQDMDVYYVVSATNPSDQSDACTTSAKVLVKADPELRRLTARGIVPVVGSVEGLNGSKFRTEVKVGPSYYAGRLIFHPIGKAASDSDPSIAYGGPAVKDTVVYPDIAAALGVTGLGSLDVVPDNPGEMPAAVEARIYNVAEDGGTFGTLEPMVSPAEYLNLTPNTQAGPPDYFLAIPGPSSGFRINVGVRSLASGMLRGTVRHQDGSVATGQMFVDGDQLVMGSPQSLFGVTVGPGETLGLEFGSAGSSGILFYTVNDNRTNDPAIAVKLKEYRRSRNYAQ